MQKKVSQSEALENLVEDIPVKERQKLSQAQPTYPNKIQKTVGSRLHNARLDLEISLYWLLSKYEQTRPKRQNLH